MTTRSIPTSYRRKVPAEGIARNGSKRVLITLDEETHDMVRSLAVKEGTSFSHQVKVLVEWGLEAK